MGKDKPDDAGLPPLDVDGVITRMKVATNVETQGALAEICKTTQQAFTNARQRGGVALSMLRRVLESKQVQPGTTLDWLLYGGEMVDGVQGKSLLKSRDCIYVENIATGGPDTPMQFEKRYLSAVASSVNLDDIRACQTGTNSFALVDTADKNVRDGLWAIGSTFAPAVRKIRVLASGFYQVDGEPTPLALSEIRVLGRVVWSCSVHS